MNSENAVSSHSGLTSVETVYEKKKGKFALTDCEKEEFD